MSKYSDLIQETYKDDIAEAPASKYSDLIQEEYGDNQTTAMKASVFSSAPVNPDQAAQQYQISKQVNLPVNIVRAKENEIKQMTELNSIDYDAIAKNFPAVATQLSDPNKSGAIRDDVDKLSYFERVVANTGQEFRNNEASAQSADLRIKKILSLASGKKELSPQEENELALYYQNREGTDYKLDRFTNPAISFAAKIPQYTIGQIPNIVDVAKTALPAALGGAAIGAATAAPTIIGVAPAASANALRAGAMGVFTRSAKLMMADSFDEYSKFVDENGKPIEPEVAAAASFLTGGIGGSLELLSGKVLLAPFKNLFTREAAKKLMQTSAGRETLKNIAKGALAEGSTEVAQEYVRIGLGEGAKASSSKEFAPFYTPIPEEAQLRTLEFKGTENLTKQEQEQYKTLQDKISEAKKAPLSLDKVASFFASEEVSKRAKESFIGGAIGGGGFSTVGAGMTYAANLYDKREQSKAEKEQIKETTQNVKESKTFNRSQELFKDVTEETLGQQNVYIPAEKVQTYFQDKTPQEVEEFYKQVPEAREQLQDALESGGNLILKGNNAYAAFAQDAYAPLQDFASLSPENITDEAYQDAFLQDVVSNVNYDETVKKVRTEQDLVNKNIETQIQNLGIPYRDAKDLITLTKAFYETNLKKYGNEQATKLLNNYFKNLQIKNEVYVDDVAEMLKKARAPQKLPKAGKPLQKFLKEKGGVKLGSNLAGELNALGITPKTAPALFKKNSGIGDVDNIPASEFADRFPNANAKVEGDYVDRQALLDLIAEEAKGADISRQISEEQRLVEDFIRQLDELGLDLNAPDEEIKKAIDEYRKGGYNQANKVEFVNPHEAAQNLITELKAIFPNIKTEISNSVNRNGDKSSYIKLDFPIINIGEIRLSDHLNSPTFSQFSEFNFVREYDLNLIVNSIKRRAQNALNTVEEAEKFKIDNKDLLKKALKANGQYHRGFVKEAGFDPDNFPSNNVLFNKVVAGVEDKKEINELEKIANPKTYFQSQDQTKTPAFKKWFGDSKVVDEKGEPLVVYHGTENNFEEFDPKAKSISGQWQGRGIYFANDYGMAQQYAGDNGKIIKAYLSVKNPLKYNLYKKIPKSDLQKLTAEQIRKIEQNLKREQDAVLRFSDLKNAFSSDEYSNILEKQLGYDGIIIGDTNLGEGEIIVFSPTQIKSVENKGTFDPENANIYLQKSTTAPRGQFKYLQGKPIISLFQDKNKSTLLHELGHTFLEIQKELSQIPEISEEATKDWKVLEDWLDIKDGNITVEAHEKFARGFEAYLREGKAPSIELRTAFARFFTWLTRIYKDVLQLNVKLNNEVREVFDRMLATQEAIGAQKNNPLFRVDDQVLELLNAKEKEDYLKISENAGLKARETLTKKALRQKEKENTKFYKQQRAVVKEEIKAAMEASPVYRALNFFKTGELYGAEENYPNIKPEKTIPYSYFAKYGIDNQSPYLLRNGELMPTDNDHLDGAQKLGFNSVEEALRDAGIIRFGGGIDVNGYRFVSVELHESLNLSEEQLSFLEKANKIRIYEGYNKKFDRPVGNLFYFDIVDNDRNIIKSGNSLSELQDLLKNNKSYTPYKLNEEQAKENYPEFYKKLKNKDIFEKDGVDLEIAAEDFGFKDDGVMMNSLVNAKPFNQELKRATDEEMIRRFGDMLFDGTIEEEAKDAMQNEARANKILYELNGINRKVKSYVENKEAYKQKAQEIFAKKPLSVATDSNQFYIAEVKAAREAGKALGKKDYEKAVAEKKKQLLNHYLYRESLQLKRELQTAYKKYAKYKKRPAQGKVVLEEEYREKIVELLANFGLAKMPEGVEFSVADLEAWKQEQVAQGVLGLVEFPEVEEFANKPFKQLTTDEFRTLNDDIENIAHTARGIRTLEVNGVKQQLETIANEIVETADKNLKDKPTIRGELTTLERLKETFDWVASSLIKTKNTALKIDGEKPLGTFYNLFVKDVAAAELKKNEMMDEAYKKLDEIYKKHFGGYKIPTKKTYFKDVNYSYDKQSVLAFALNWGNEINRKRIRDGFGYSDAQVQSIISSLTPNEWAFVQDMWDLINSYWSSVEALEKKLFGIAPRKQKALSFKITLDSGETIDLKGGYYPLSYTDKSNFLSDVAADIKEMMFGATVDKINFHKSFTKERTEQKVSKEVDLTLRPAFQHISQVVNDIAMKEFVWNSYKIINNRKVKSTLANKLGLPEFKQLQSWLYDMYGRVMVQEGFLTDLAKKLRSISTTFRMGFKAATVLIQITGFLQSIPKVGYKNMGIGLWKALGNGNPAAINKAAKLAFAKSKILKDRSTTFNRDIYEVMNRLRNKGEIKAKIAKFAFLGITKMQMLVDIPTWYAAYYKGLKDFKGDDAKAVEFADLTLEKTQGSSHKQALSAIERNEGAMARAFTTFYTYFNVKLNLLSESYRGTDFKKPSDVAKFASDFLLLFFLDAVMTEFLREGIFSGKDSDDEEDKALHYLNMTAGSLAATVPGISQLYSKATGFNATPAGLQGLDIVGGGIGKLGKETIKAFDEDEEVDLFKVLQGLNETGAVFGYGGGSQIDVFIKALKEQENGEDVAPINYILKAQKK